MRAWAEAALALREGDAVIDVGCGPGTAAIALAPLVGASGQVRGIDVSQMMIDEASRRAASLPNVSFSVGDAGAIDAGDESFDAYRSERTYQWLAEPEQALAEGLRVLRPGGRVAIIDSDWGTLTIDHPDAEVSHRMRASTAGPPNRWAGRRLLNQVRRAGLNDVRVTTDVILATSWDPDATPGVGGVVPFPVLVHNVVQTGAVSEAEAAAWLTTLEDEAREGRFFLSLMMVAVAGTKP
jgi:SAM-dependent methyltransferase